MWWRRLKHYIEQKLKQSQAQKPQVFCRDCKFSRGNVGEYLVCDNPLTSEVHQSLFYQGCGAARRRFPCGPDGKLFEAKLEEKSE